MTESVLSRFSESTLAQSTNLTSTQAMIDGAVGQFVEQASDWRSLAAMSAGSIFFRLGRMGTLALGSNAGAFLSPLVRGSSYVIGLGTEVAAFEGTSRFLSYASGDRSNPHLFDWSGHGGLWEGLRSSFVNFGALKVFGHLGHGQNMVVSNLMADLGMVAGHEAAFRLGLAPAQEGTFVERMVHAQITNIQMGASMSLMGQLFPHVQATERALDLELQARASRMSILNGSSGSSLGLHPSLATPEGVVFHEGTGEANPLSGNQMMARINLGDVFTPEIRRPVEGFRERTETRAKEQNIPLREPANEAEEALQLLTRLRCAKNIDNLRPEKREEAIRTLHDYLEQNVSGTRALEEFTNDPELLATYYQSRVDLGYDNPETGEFHRPRSAWATPGRKVGLIAAGQGADWLAELRQLYQIYPETRRLIEEQAAYLLELSSTHPAAQSGHEIDLMDWIRNPNRAPDANFLNLADINAAPISLVSLAHWEVVRRRGFTADNVELRGGTGFSQGMMPMLVIGEGMSARDLMATQFYQGVAFRESDPGYSGRKPMGSVSNISLEQLREWTNAIQKSMGDDHRIAINRNTEWFHTISGSREAIAALRQRVEAENKNNRKGTRDVGLMEIETESRFHNTASMALGEALLRQYHQEHTVNGENVPLNIDPSRLKMGVYSTFDGTDLRTVENPLEVTVLDRSQREFDFVRQTQPFEGVDLVIDLGPGNFVSTPAGKNLAGTGARVISFGGFGDVARGGWAELFNTNPSQVKAGQRYEQPQVVQLPDGTLFIDNSFLRANQGEIGSFVQIGAMTPQTGPVESVIEAANREGILVGLSSGSWGAELPNAMRKVAEGTHGEVMFNTNLMAIWRGFGAQVEDTFKTRQETGSPVGIEVTAGLPDDLPGFVNRAQGAGVHHPQLKIGPAAQVEQITNMLKENREMTQNGRGLVVALEGGEAGGHHAPQSGDVQWAESYDALAKAGVIPVAAGGLSTPEQIARVMTQGRLEGRRRPSASAIVGSFAQNFDVMTTSQAAREASVRATSKDIGSLPSAAGGPQHMIRNQYYERCRRFDALADGQKVVENGKTSYRPFSAEQVQEIIRDLNTSETKPWFAMVERPNAEGKTELVPTELRHMTFGQVMNRWIELSTFENQMRPPYPEYYNHTFVTMMRTMERFLGDRIGRKNHTVNADANFMEPNAAREQAEAFLRGLGSAANLPVGAEVARAMEDIWHSAGEFVWDGKENKLVMNHFPQRFMTQITPERLVADYKSGQTQMAIYEQGYTAENLLIQTGTTAANDITEARVSLHDWHTRTVEATVQAAREINPNAPIREVSEPGARPFEARALSSVKGVQGIGERTDGDNTIRSFRVTSDAVSQAPQFIQALLGQGTGVLRTAMDVRYRFNESGERVPNTLARVFEPRQGQVVEVVTKPSGDPARPDPVLVGVRIYEPSPTAQPSASNLMVEYLADSASRARLVIHEHTKDGRDTTFEWQYDVSRHHGYMTRVQERSVNPYESYQNLFQYPAPDANGVFRSEYEVTGRDLDRFRNAVGDDSQPYKQKDGEGHRMAPLSMVARFGAEAWTGSAFTAIPGGNPANLRHTFDRVEYLGNRERWVREGDRLSTEARITGEYTTDSGRMRSVEAVVYLNGEAVARSISEFLTFGDFNGQAGFARRERQMTLRADQAFVRAVQEKNDQVMAFQFNSDHTPQNGHEYRVEVVEEEQTSEQGDVTSRLTGRIFQGTQEVGFILNTSLRNQGETHPLLDTQFIKQRFTPELGYTPFTGARDPISRRDKQAPLSPAVYSQASGDINPIHTNPYLARQVGMDTVIAQGMWTKASALATLSASPLVEGRVGRIHNVDARMQGIVEPGDKLTDHVEELGAVNGRIVVQVRTTGPNHDPKTREATPIIDVLTLRAEVDQPHTVYGRPGQGDQKPGMFGEILANPVGKGVLEELDQFTRREHGFSLIQMVQNGGKELHFVPVAGRARMAPVKHPEHVIHRTEMSQAALFAYYAARDRMLDSAGVRQPEGVEIGNSVGEYSIPYSNGKISLSDAFNLHLYRGRVMQRFVDPLRNADGSSPFRMDAVAVISRPEAEQIVARVRQETGRFVQIANHNKPSQITITGEIEAVNAAGQAIDAHLIQKGRINRGTSAVTQLPIDTPFHSQILSFGIPEFWNLLESLPMQEGRSLDGRYVPCIHGEVFRVTPEYADGLVQFINRYEAGTRTDAFRSTMNMMKERGFETERLYGELQSLMNNHRAELQRIAAGLRDGTVSRLEAENYFLKVGLAYQFASPVEWVRVQETAFGQAGGERFVELGASTTLTDMLKSTLPKVQGDRTRLINQGRGVETFAVSNPTEWGNLVRAAKPSNGSNGAAKPSSPAAETPKAENPAPAPVAVAPAAAAPAAAVAAGAPVADRAVTAMDVVRTLVAMAKSARPEEIDPTKSLSDIMGGSQAALPVVNQYLAVEFPGVTVPDGPHKVPLSELVSAIEGQVRIEGPGPKLREMFAKRVADNLSGVVDAENAWAHLAGEWPGLPAGRRLDVFMRSLTQSRGGKSTLDGQDLGAGGLVLSGSTDGRAWLDGLVRHYGSSEGVALVSATEARSSGGGGGGGVQVDLAELDRRQDMRLASLFLKQVYPGMDVDAVEALIGERDQLRGDLSAAQARDAKMTRLREILGDNFANTLEPVFSADRARSIHGNFVDAEMTNWIFEVKQGVREGRITNLDSLPDAERAHLNRMINRATPRTLAMIRYHLGQVRQELDAIRNDYPRVRERISDPRQATGAEHLTSDIELLEQLREHGRTQGPRLESYEGILTGLEQRLASQIPNPGRPDAQLMNPNGEANAPVFKPADTYQGGFTRPTFRVREDGKPEYRETPRPNFGPVELVNEFREGGELRREGQPVTVEGGETRRIQFLSGPHRDLILDVATDVAQNGLTFQDRREDGGLEPQVALLTGASPSSINVENLKALAAGGAHIVVTTSKADFNQVVRGTEYGDIPLLEYVERVFHDHRGRGAKLDLVSMNMGSPEDVRGLTQFLRDNHLYPRYLFNYAAWSLKSDSHMAVGAFENPGDGLATWNVNMEGYRRLVGGLISNMKQDGMTAYRLAIAVPGSPNTGGLPGGAYPFVQAAKHTLLNEWHSDPELNQHTVMVDHAFGWIRGTNLMADNNNAALPLEQQTGIRTHSQAEAAFWTMVGMHPRVLEAAEKGPIVYSSEAGFSQLEPGELSSTYRRVLTDISERSAYLKSLHDANEADRAAAAKRGESSGGQQGRQQQRQAEPIVQNLFIPPTQAPTVFVRGTDEPIHQPLDRVIVAVAADRFVSGGDRVTSRDLYLRSSVRQMEDPSLMRLATIMGRIQYDPKLGRYVDVATKAGEPINSRGVRERYGDWMDQHVGVRQIEPELHNFDPQRDRWLMKITLASDQVIENLDATQLRQLQGEQDTVINMGGGKFRLVKPQGSVQYFWAEAPLDRQLAGQIPTGWDPVADGFPRSFIAENSRAGLFLMRATAGALSALGESPESIERDPLLSHRLGLAMGTGLGGQDYARDLQVLGVFNEPARDGAGKPIVQGLPNMPEAMVAMAYLRNYTGPKNCNIAACGTTAESLATGIYQLVTGEVDVVVVGGTEAPIGQGATKRFAEINATQTIDYLVQRGINPQHAADLVFSVLANGFVPGEGAGAMVLTRGDVAYERGWPVEGIVSGVTNTSGGQSMAAASPDRGPVTRMPYLYDAYGRPFGLTPDQVIFQETHGTGTVLGDANDARIANDTATYAGRRTPGNLLIPNAPKRRAGHTMGEAAMDAMIEGLDTFMTGRFPSRDGLQTLSPVIQGTLHTLMLNRFGVQVDPATLDAYAFASYGFGKENFLGVMLNGRRYWNRLVIGNHGQRGWAGYQGRLEGTMQRIDDTQGDIRTGRRPLVQMNDAITRGQATTDNYFDKKQEEIRAWLASNYARAMGNGRAR